MTKPKKLKRHEIVKEIHSEDWCFVCKDGGDLILCEHSNCLKVYHAGCVVKDDSSTDIGERWTCDRHSCSECHKSTKFYCYCCPNATCGQCVQAAELALVKGNQGLCSECLELVLLVEEKVNLDADGGQIDLHDRNTFECLFLEYWDIIKEKEGLNLEDVYAADARLKKGPYFKTKTIGNGRKESKDIYFITSDSDAEDSEELETVTKVKGSKEFGFLGWGSKRELKTVTKVKGSKAVEFSGWGSKPLVQFLRSLGKDTTKEFSQYDVHSIICQYIQQKELFDPNKRKRIICDESLYSLFRRKFTTKNRIYNLLEPHFVVNIDSSDEGCDEVENCTLVKNEKTLVVYKKRKTLNSDRKCQEVVEEEEAVAQESCFASLVSENIKLVYLRKSLVQKLSNDPQNFEHKVIGSFVRVKSDPRDCTQRNSHQLLQVEGVKQTSGTGENQNVVLRLANIATDVNVSKLSDIDFCEEEIDDLRQTVEKGVLPKLIVVELELKAKVLHEDITKDWIEKEIARLQKRIEFANEKGRRRELHEYLEQLEQLKKPCEQERLMKKLPKVIAELLPHKQDLDELQNGSHLILAEKPGNIA